MLVLLAQNLKCFHFKVLFASDEAFYLKSILIVSVASEKVHARI